MNWCRPNRWLVDGKHECVPLNGALLRKERIAAGVDLHRLAAWALISPEKLFDIENALPGEAVYVDFQTARLLVIGVTGRKEL